MGNRRSPRQGQPGNNRQNGRECHGGDKAEEQITADRIRQMHRRHVGAADQCPCRILKYRVRADQQNGAEADNKGQDIEVANESGGIKHTLTRFFGITDREETHDNMRQPGGTEHQRQPQR